MIFYLKILYYNKNIECKMNETEVIVLNIILLDIGKYPY